MNHFIHFPDAVDTSGTTITPNDSDTPIRRIRNVPAKDADLLNVSAVVADKWAESPFITLLWKSQSDFATGVTNFKAALEKRNTEGGKRGQQTAALDSIDEQADDAVPYVKAYINEKFGPSKGTSHYAAFGLHHSHHSYELPADRQKRRDALRMMAEAITANGFDTKTYGAAFWADINTRYKDALAAATLGAGNVSARVSDLVQMRTGLRRVLHSILLLLEANYPDSFDEMKRSWGFMKENY